MRPLVLVLLLLPVHAFAADKAAEVLVERAVAAYKQGDYGKAGAFFLEAYELSRVPAQLRNAAKAYQAADDLERAEDLWSQLAAIESLSTSERAEAEAQLQVIEERRKAITAEEEAARAREEALRARTATVASAPPVTAEAPKFRLPVGPVVTLAAAVAFAAAGGGLYYHSDTKLRDLDDRLSIKDDDDLIVGIDRLAAEDELEGVNRERTIAYALAGVAGAAALTGVVWWLLDLW
jgi:tetratricopeptide (TPR) repeat protein